MNPNKNKSRRIEPLRRLRKILTFGFLRMGMELSRRGSKHTVEEIRQVLFTMARLAPPLRKRLIHNMKQAGVYRPKLVEAHLERAIDQIVMLGHIFRAGFTRSGCPEKFKFDDSFKLLEQAHAAGKGVINISPHICGFPLYPPVVTPRIPCSIYLRRNTDPRKMHLNQSIGNAGDGHLVYPPAHAPKAQRLQVAINVLRQGKMLFITPDTPRKSHEGIPVTIFQRTVFFPTGIFVMSLRTGAPVVPITWHWENDAYHIRYDQPIVLTRGGNLKKKTETAMLKWTQSVDAFLHKHPEMWWNWLDKRWTRILSDD